MKKKGKDSVEGGGKEDKLKKNFKVKLINSKQKYKQQKMNMIYFNQNFKLRL